MYNSTPEPKKLEEGSRKYTKCALKVRCWFNSSKFWQRLSLGIRLIVKELVDQRGSSETLYTLFL